MMEIFIPVVLIVEALLMKLSVRRPSVLVILSKMSIISEYMPELFNTGFEYPWSNVYFATALFESRIVKLEMCIRDRECT